MRLPSSAKSRPPRHNSSGSAAGFVGVVEGRFDLDGEVVRFLGSNLWYAAYLGAPAPFGDRARLGRELDRLRALGVTNLRILAGSEESPLANAVEPAFRNESRSYRSELLEGLDFVLVELKKRGMRAVLYLTNFWEWSGGMMTYLYWTNGGRFVEPTDPAQPWPRFPDFAASFYGSEAAVALYHDYVRALVGRTNQVSGELYAKDPTIFSFQLANEPRPGVSPKVVEENRGAFLAWLRATAQLIRSLAPHHLISTGSEGLVGCAGNAEDVLLSHDHPDIDYLTAHVWPENWSWVDPKDLERTHLEGESRAREYITQHSRLADALGRPLVIEEFGFPRDERSFSPDGTTAFRERFYALVLGAVIESARAGGPLSGSNFWAWGGEGRALHEDCLARRGETSYLGDPPHEPQGWYSVFDSDERTHALLRAHAEELASFR